MDTYDIMIHLLIAKFMAKLFKNERFEFTLILQVMQKKTKRDNNKKDHNTNNNDDKISNLRQLLHYHIMLPEIHILLAFFQS